jgi:RNA polymerase sigma-70 factor (ECF subfamily)
MSGGMAEPGDRELVEAFRRGDAAAFDALVLRYVRLAGGVAYGILGDYEAAADAVQEAFLKVHGALGELREPERFKGWLYGIVRSCALDAARRDRRRRTASLSGLDGREDDPPLATAAGGREPERPAAGAERREAEERILRAVQDLPESYREVVIMKYLDERSYKEISETLGITIETIESRLFRARKLLRTRLQDLVAEGAE